MGYLATGDGETANVAGLKQETRTACRILLIEDDAPVRIRRVAIIDDWAGGRLSDLYGTLWARTARSDETPHDPLATFIAAAAALAGTACYRAPVHARHRTMTPAPAISAFAWVGSRQDRDNANPQPVLGLSAN